jgi:hypothetical protein
VEAILDAARKQKDSDRRFMASIQGVDLGEKPADSDEVPADFDDVVRRAQAKARGVSQEALEWSEIGFTVEED